MTSEQLKHMKELCASKRFAHYPLEIDMTKFPTILTRRSIFRAGAGLAVAATATPFFTRASAWAEDAVKPARNPQTAMASILSRLATSGDRDLGWLGPLPGPADPRNKRL